MSKTRSVKSHCALRINSSIYIKKKEKKRIIIIKTAGNKTTGHTEGAVSAPGAKGFSGVWGLRLNFMFNKNRSV